MSLILSDGDCLLRALPAWRIGSAVSGEITCCKSLAGAKFNRLREGSSGLAFAKRLAGAGYPLSKITLYGDAVRYLLGPQAAIPL